MVAAHVHIIKHRMKLWLFSFEFALFNVMLLLIVVAMSFYKYYGSIVLIQLKSTGSIVLIQWKSSGSIGPIQSNLDYPDSWGLG